MPQKKILFVITKSNWGGAQRYVFDLATELSKDRFETIVALGGTGEKGSSTGRLAEELQRRSVRTVFIRSFMRNISLWQDARIFFELYATFKKERPDIIHLNSSKATVAGAVAGRLAGVPCIIATVHGWAFNEERLLPVRVLLKWLQWFSVILCHKTITVSAVDAAQAASWPLVKGKIFSIHNGTAHFPLQEKGAARAHLVQLDNKLSAYTEHLWIGTSSELHKNKGLDFLLSAYARMNRKDDCICVIISSGEERESLELLAAQLGIAERIFFLGFVPEAREYLRAFDIFTMTSRKEGLPYVILEAGIAKNPCVASRIGGIPEVIEDRKSGMLVEIGDIKAITASLDELASSETLRRDLGEALHDTVEKRFSLSHMLEKTAACYLS